MIDEKRLSAALHNLAEPGESGPAPIDDLVQRGRRSRRNRLARTTGITMAGVAMVAGLVVVTRSGEPSPVPLALAAQTTQRTTFRFEQAFTIKSLDGKTVVLGPATYQGAYDPVHDRGYQIHMFPGRPDRAEEQRQIGDDCYGRYSTHEPWHWSSMSAKSPGCWRLTDSAEGAALGVSASPGDLLAELENTGQVRYAGRTDDGRREVDTYRFTYRYVWEEAYGEQRVFEKHGTVDIEVAARRVIRLVSVSTDVTGDGERPLPLQQELTLSDFGQPVVVKKPTPVANR